MMKTKKRFIITGILTFTALVVWVLWANTALELNTVTVQENSLPLSFDGFRIAHVSDLHSAQIGQGNEELIATLAEAEPDIIAITGDLMDCRDTDVSIALAFAEQAVQIAPCYYVTGNHEVLLPDALYAQLIGGLTALGVTVLDDDAVLLTRDGESICIAGHAWGSTAVLGSITDFEGYTILLSHPPEDVRAYAEHGFDLVLSGHAHGGQFRLPFIGGLYAPGQGFFPEYDSGLYSLGETDLIVSRGIGNSTIPVRFNNRPEVILVILECLTPSE